MSGYVKLFGGQQQSKSERAAAQISASGVQVETAARVKTDLFNAGQLERDASEAISQANLDARRARRTGNQRLGAQRADIGKSGFTFEGFADLVRDSEREVDIDEMLIRRGGMLRAEQLFNQANATRASADFTGTAGTIAQQTALFTGEVRARGARLAGTVGFIEGLENAARGKDLVR